MWYMYIHSVMLMSSSCSLSQCFLSQKQKKIVHLDIIDSSFGLRETRINTVHIYDIDLFNTEVWSWLLVIEIPI